MVASREGFAGVGVFPFTLFWEELLRPAVGAAGVAAAALACTVAFGFGPGFDFALTVSGPCDEERRCVASMDMEFSNCNCRAASSGVLGAET